MVFPQPVLIFLNKILSLYSQIVGLPRTCWKIFLLEKVKLYDRLYPENCEEKNAQNQHPCLFLIQEAIKAFFQQNLIRQSGPVTPGEGVKAKKKKKTETKKKRKNFKAEIIKKTVTKFKMLLF